MRTKKINIALIGKTNSGKSTFINAVIGEKISIENKKINTTKDIIAGIVNINKTQIVLYDTPGLDNFNSNLKNKKKINTLLNNLINDVDFIFLIIDVYKYKFKLTLNHISKFNVYKKPIIIIFNKIDLIKKEKVLRYIDELSSINLVKDFFIISAKYNNGINVIKDYLIKRSQYNDWKYTSNEITNKSVIFISNECTRNSILKYLHKEIPYNVDVQNKLYKKINKKNIKIKQAIEIYNRRYKAIILGKNGQTIKKIRENSQKEISQIFNSKIHLYLEVVIINAK